MSTDQRVFLDTSIFIGAAIPGSNHSSSTRAFCQRIAAARTVVVFSAIMRYEYAHIAHELANPASRRFLPPAMISDHDLVNWDTDLMVRSGWMATIRENLDRLLHQFAYFVEAPIRADAWPVTLEIMARHDLRSYDALHAATARYYSVDSFASCDRHFANVDGLNVTIVRDR